MSAAARSITIALLLALLAAPAWASARIKDIVSVQGRGLH